MPSKRKLINIFTKILEGLHELKKENVSYYLVLHMGGKTQYYGTAAVKEVFISDREAIEQALKNDALALCRDKVDDECVDDINSTNAEAEARDKVYQLMNGEGLQRLPYPLSLMNRKEKLSCVRHLIVYDRYQRGGNDSTKIKAGDRSWEPRFWPNRFLKWKDLKVNIGRVKKDHLKGVCPTEFYTYIIEEAFRMYGLDPEKYIDCNLDGKKLMLRKKGLGIHNEPTVSVPVGAIEQFEDINDDQNGVDDQMTTVEQENEEHNEVPTTSANNLQDCSTGNDWDVPQLADVSCHPHLNDHRDQDGLRYLDIPDSAKDLATAMKMRFNEGNGNCLCQAVSQQNNLIQSS